MIDWFAVNQRRLESTAVWKDWKSKLISTFGDYSWKPIKYALNFKYVSGSYIDYVIKKERILLELDRKLPDMVILDLIVVGLPSRVQNTLNRHTVTSIEILHNKIKKFEAKDKVTDGSSKFKKFNKIENFGNVNSENNNKSNNFIEKKPRSNCTERGFPDRFHPENTCWFRQKKKKKNNNNNNNNKTNVNNVKAYSSISEEEQKN
ncbi:hypothetical protein PGB90_003290 [Kerria lacca]